MNDSRSPRIQVLVNGVAVAGILSAAISSNSHLAANRFSIEVALSANTYDVWTNTVLNCEICVQLGGGWASLIYGQVDELDIDVGRKLVRVEGRDLTSRFIETRIQESFENQTASEIATILARRRGLTAAVIATSAVVGRSFQNGCSRLALDQHSRNTTEWDLLIQLAEGEGFDVWVDGQQLNFAPPDQNASTLLMTPSDCISLKLRRLVTLSSGLQVDVKSWDLQGQRAVIQTAQTSLDVQDPRIYAVIRPNISDAAAKVLAQRLLGQMAQHERSVSIEMPGDITTQPRDILYLSGTDTDFDGTWTVTEVDRHLSFQGGFTQVLEARIPTWTAF